MLTHSHYYIRGCAPSHILHRRRQSELKQGQILPHVNGWILWSEIKETEAFQSLAAFDPHREDDGSPLNTAIAINPATVDQATMENQDVAITQRSQKPARSHRKSAMGINFSRAGEIKKIIMGLDKNTKTPCGFCFVLYYSREDTEDAVKYISGTILDDRPIRVDFDWGFKEGRQWGRGRSGGQVRDEYRTDYDPGRGGYGKLVQKELEAQRQLVDYGTGSLGSYPPAMPSYGRHGGGGHGHGGSHRQGRDYHRKRHRDDDRHGHEMSKRGSDHDFRRNADHDSRPEKNPRFRESGDSDDEEEEDDRKRRP